jgi:hypothetical protein
MHVDEEVEEDVIDMVSNEHNSTAVLTTVKSKYLKYPSKLLFKILFIKW